MARLVRTLGIAKEVAGKSSIQVEHLLDNKRKLWAGHLIRLGCESGVSHVVKFVLTWRPLTWWRDQQVYNSVTLDLPVTHPPNLGFPRRWEESLYAGWAIDLGRKCARL